mgnify:CR=1 FL=1
MKLLTEGTKANPKALELAGIRGMVYDVRHLQVSHRVPRGVSRVERESREENSENENSLFKAKEENALIDRDRASTRAIGCYTTKRYPKDVMLRYRCISALTANAPRGLAPRGLAKDSGDRRNELV